MVEINLTRSRLKEKPRDSLTQSVVWSRLNAIGLIWVEARKTHAEIITRNDAGSDPYVNDGVFATIQTAYEDALDEFLG